MRLKKLQKAKELLCIQHKQLKQERTRIDTLTSIFEIHVEVSSDLERVEEQVAEKANEAQHGAFRDGLIDDEGEEDGVNPKEGNKGQSGLC